MLPCKVEHISVLTFLSCIWLEFWRRWNAPCRPPVYPHDNGHIRLVEFIFDFMNKLLYPLCSIRLLSEGRTHIFPVMIERPLGWYRIRIWGPGQAVLQARNIYLGITKSWHLCLDSSFVFEGKPLFCPYWLRHAGAFCPHGQYMTDSFLASSLYSRIASDHLISGTHKNKVNKPHDAWSASLLSVCHPVNTKGKDDPRILRNYIVSLRFYSPRYAGPCLGLFSVTQSTKPRVLVPFFPLLISVSKCSPSLLIPLVARIVQPPTIGQLHPAGSIVSDFNLAVQSCSLLHIVDHSSAVDNHTVTVNAPQENGVENCNRNKILHRLLNSSYLQLLPFDRKIFSTTCPAASGRLR